MRCYPSGCCITILDGCGELVLWRQPISDRDDQTGHGIAEAAANAIGGIKSSKGPSSTEEVDEHGERPLAFRLIESRRNFPSCPCNGTADNTRDRLENVLAASKQ